MVYNKNAIKRHIDVSGIHTTNPLCSCHAQCFNTQIKYANRLLALYSPFIPFEVSLFELKSSHLLSSTISELSIPMETTRIGKIAEHVSHVERKDKNTCAWCKYRSKVFDRDKSSASLTILSSGMLPPCFRLRHAFSFSSSSYRLFEEIETFFSAVSIPRNGSHHFSSG